jgi:hypothetical protein
MTQEKEQALFDKYPKIFQRPDTPKENLMFFGFECNDGWFWLIDNLCALIQGLIDLNPHLGIPQVVAMQVKEKFGTLRFYYNGGNEEISGMVSFAEYLSGKICEKCGSQDGVSQTKGWIVTLCQSCMDQHNKKQLSNSQEGQGATT